MSETVRWYGPHGWRFGKLIREDEKYAYVQLGTNKTLTRVPLEKIKSWPGEKKK